MKLALLSILLLFSQLGFANDVVTEPVAPVEETVPSVNLDDIQFIFTALANDLVDTYDYLESGSVFIDQEETDLDIGKFKFSIDTKTIPLDWETAEEQQVIELTAGIQTNVTVDPETSHKIVSLTGGVNIKANVMPLLKQVAVTFGECEIIPDADIVDNSDRIANLICLAFMGVAESETVKDLKPHLDAIAEKAKELAENQEEENSIISQILGSLVIGETATGLEISTILNIDAFNIKTDRLVLTAEEDSLSLTFSGTATLPEEEFNGYLNDLKRLLAEIADYENDEEEETLYYVIADYAFIIFNVLEGFIYP